MKKEERNKEIIKLVKEGKTYQEIGERFGISRQRVQQIAKKEGIKKERKKKYKCIVCGKEIKTQRKYCNTCRENLKKPTFICINCGKFFRRYLSEAKVKNIRFCSDKCRLEYITKHNILHKLDKKKKVRLNENINRARERLNNTLTR